MVAIKSIMFHVKPLLIIALVLGLSACMNTQQRYDNAMSHYDATYLPAAHSGRISWEQYYSGRQRWSEHTIDTLRLQQMQASQALIGTGQGITARHSYYPAPRVHRGGHCFNDNCY